MAKEKLPKFSPVEEAIRLVRQDLSKTGWSETDWNLAQKLTREHVLVLNETRVEIRYTLPKTKKPRQWAGDLGQALAKSVEKFKEVFETRPNWDSSRLAELKERDQARRDQEREARRRHLHLLNWTDPLKPKITSLPRDDPGLLIKSIEFANDPVNFYTRALALHQRVSGRVILLVEGAARLRAAVSLISLVLEAPLPERMFLMGIVANKEEVDPVKEFLLAQLEGSPGKLIGVIPRGEDTDRLCLDILAALKEAFPPPDPDSLSQN